MDILSPLRECKALFYNMLSDHCKLIKCQLKITANLCVQINYSSFLMQWTHQNCQLIFFSFYILLDTTSVYFVDENHNEKYSQNNLKIDFRNRNWWNNVLFLTTRLQCSTVGNKKYWWVFSPKPSWSWRQFWVRKDHNKTWNFKKVHLPKCKQA